MSIANRIVRMFRARSSSGDYTIVKPASEAISLTKASKSEEVGPITEPKTDSLTRAPLETLELVYRSDEIVQAIIHKYIVSIIGSGIFISSPHPETAKVLEDFIKSTNLLEELKEVIRNAFVYGTAYMEKVYNRKKAAIVKLPSVNPKNMDFERDERGLIKLDPVTKEPVGYKFTSYGAYGTKEAVLPRDKVVIVKFFSLPDSWSGFSPLETLVTVVTYRKNIDLGIGEAGHSSAYPGYVVYIGDKDKFPTVPQKAIDDAVKELKNIGQKTVFAFPWYYKLEKMPIEGVRELARFSDHFITCICGALLFPKALLTIPERAAGNVLSAQLAEWEKTVEGFQTSLATQLSAQVFDEVCMLAGVPAEYEVKFKLISPVTERDRARTVATLVRSGAIIPGKELDKYLRKQLGIPLEEEAKEEQLSESV